MDDNSIDQAILNQDWDYLDQIIAEDERFLEDELAFIACELDSIPFFEHYLDQMEINNAEDLSCPYLCHRSPELQDYLLRKGAYISWIDCAEGEMFRYSRETVNNQILHYDADLQKEVYEEFLKQANLTEQEFIEKAENDPDFEVLGMPLENICSGLNIEIADNKVSLEKYDSYTDMEYEEDVLEALGYSLDYESIPIPHGEVGVFYIR